jgi:DNA ligase D-like protein (predicted 3'-phosphoesterase)
LESRNVRTDVPSPLRKTDTKATAKRSTPRASDRRPTANGDATSLRTYREQRDFKKTPEPRGSRRRSRRTKRAPIFVVQEHDATTRHWDFRLQVGVVLASWAVPKGPSLNPSDKRMAMRTEDHPLEYADFEGTIPEGQYGTGPVIVWDRGTFRNTSERRGQEISIEKGIESGHASVWLDGQKLAGGFALARVAKGKRERWLLVKKADEQADRRRKPVRSDPRSVISGRTVDEVS